MDRDFADFYRDFLAALFILRKLDRHWHDMGIQSWQLHSSAYSKRVPRTNCALRIKKCASRISGGIYFFKHKLINK